MKLLLRTSLMILIVFAIFAAFSGTSNQAFGSIGQRPGPAPCMPQPPSQAAQGHTAFCAK
jgi:hypothetical protein